MWAVSRRPSHGVSESFDDRRPYQRKSHGVRLALARLTPCDFRLLLDAETTKRRKSHGVSAPKTIVVRWFYQRDSCWTDSKIESVQLPSHCVSGSKTAVASTDRSQTNHSKAFSWRIADTNSWPIFSENGEGRRWGLIEWRRWKCVNRHLADEACPVWCDRSWRYYYWIPKINFFVKINLSLDQVLVSCSKLNIYVDLIGFMIYKPLIFVHIFVFS